MIASLLATLLRLNANDAIFFVLLLDEQRPVPIQSKQKE